VLKSFQTNYGGGTATGEDFKETAENITGLNFNQFFEQWYYGQGFPQYNFKYWTDDQNTFFLSSTQTTSSLHTVFYNMLLDFRLHFIDGSDTLVQFRQTDNLNVFSMEFDQRVINVEVDPEQWTLEETLNISNIEEIVLLPMYFTIGPNPVKNKLNVYFLNADSAEHNITIYNLAGQQVFFKIKTSDIHFEVNTFAFRSGVYFISVSNGNDVNNEKVCKIEI